MADVAGVEELGHGVPGLRGINERFVHARWMSEGARGAGQPYVDVPQLISTRRLRDRPVHEIQIQILQS